MVGSALASTDLIDRAQEHGQHHADRDKPLVTMAQRQRIAGYRMTRSLRGYRKASNVGLAGNRPVFSRGARAALIIHGNDLHAQG